MIGALAVTEPDGGSDVAALRTTARRDGDHYVVNGAKTFITSGARADFVTTAVRTGEPGSGYGGVSLLVIDKGTPGFTVTRGWRSSAGTAPTRPSCPLWTSGCRRGNLVGAEDTGFAQIMRHFASERISMAVQACATAQRCLDLTIALVPRRHTFGATAVAAGRWSATGSPRWPGSPTVARTFVWSLASAIAAGERCRRSR